MRLPIIAATMILLGGCNREPEVSLINASPEEVAKQVSAEGAETRLQAGRWESRAELVSVEAPGMPPQALEMMRAAFARAKPGASCLTEEQARRPAADFFTGGKAQDCTYEKFDLAGGKLDSVLRCGAPGGPQMRMTMNGTFGGDRFDATLSSRTDMMGAPAGQAGSMTMQMKISARRTGACNGSEKA